VVLNGHAVSRKGCLQLLKWVKTVLDVGCGLGLDYALYLEHEINVDYVGIDACKGFVEYNKKLYPEAKFIHGKSYDLPFDDKSFDLVTCRHVLEHLKEAEPTIRQMCRVGNQVGIVWFNPPGVEKIKLTKKGFYKNTYCKQKLKKLVDDLGFALTVKDFKHSGKRIHQLWHLTPST